MARRKVGGAQRSRPIGVREPRSTAGGTSGASDVRPPVPGADKARRCAPSLMDGLRAKYPGMARMADSGRRQKAIRLFCLWCMGGSAAEVERCGSFECPLWPYRRGRGVERRAPRAGDARGG